MGGYAFGNALERFIGHVRRAEKFIIIGVLVGACIAQGIIFLRRRIAEKLEEEEREIAASENTPKEGE